MLNRLLTFGAPELSDFSRVCGEPEVQVSINFMKIKDFYDFMGRDRQVYGHGRMLAIIIPKNEIFFNKRCCMMMLL